MTQYAKLKNKAKRAFTKRQYKQALTLLSLAHALNTEHKESLQLNVLCALADMAIEHEEEARALFEYYHIINKKNEKEASEMLLSMIDNFDKNIYALNLAITRLEDIEVDKNDGILYADFETLAKKIGFKEAFEDLMFSSKIIFTNKNDFLIFMQSLVKHGFRDIAIHYFENIGDMLFFDKDFAHLYQKILYKES